MENRQSPHDTCANIPSTPEKRSERFLDKVMKVVDQQAVNMSQRKFEAAKAKVKEISARVSRRRASS
jgi:hypothetical protein